jgi:hypothetical protein
MLMASSHLTDSLGFDVPLNIASVLTGHIDVLQIRNSQLHILDYKPNAAKEKPIGQLMSYALAISRRTGLRLYDIVCAWFDEKDYFEFYPLHVIHKRGPNRAGVVLPHRIDSTAGTGMLKTHTHSTSEQTQFTL